MISVALGDKPAGSVRSFSNRSSLSFMARTPGYFGGCNPGEFAQSSNLDATSA